MSTLRARCPDCRTLTAVAIGPEYQCHSCGREYAAGLVRVPRAWGTAGEAMAGAASLPLPYPEAAVIEEATLDDQVAAQGRNLPALPLVLGGCCCAHLGAIVGLSARRGRLAVVWIDAHGDLNTPATSPSGNAVGNAAADGNRRRRRRARRCRARRRAEPRSAGGGLSAARPGSTTTSTARCEGCDRVYVAFDCDVLRPGELAVFMPEPGGPTLAEAEALLGDVAARLPLAGLGLTGLRRRSGRRRRREARGGRRPVTVCREPRSKMAQMSATDKIDVSIEHKQATLDDGTAKKHPNTCPGCGSHYRDDELQAHLRVCPQCSHHFPVRGLERIEQLADPAPSPRTRPGCAPATRSGSSTSSRTRSASPRPRSRPASATR